MIFNEKELKSFLIDVSKIKETEPSKVVDKYGKGYNFHIKRNIRERIVQIIIKSYLTSHMKIITK